MNSLIILLFALFVGCAQCALNEEQKAKVAEYTKACQEVSGADSEIISKAKQGEFADDQKLKDFYHCVMKKAGYQNEAGEILVDVIRAKVPEDVEKSVAEKIIETCKDLKGDTPADTAFLVYKCYRKTKPENVSFVLP